MAIETSANKSRHAYRTETPVPINVNGTSGDDTLTGTAGDDTLNGLGGDDRLFGLEGMDMLNGGDGNDILDDGTGFGDRMTGGPGNDTYYVDSMFDRIVELPGEGTDRVAASDAFGLPDNVEILESVNLTGTAGLTLVGNQLDNIIVGDNGNNQMLAGGDGNDVLVGAGGTDYLDGGRGIDAMYGGPGDDLYLVSESGDIAAELPGEGYDEIRAEVSYVLPENSAIEVLGAFFDNRSTPLDLTGNGVGQAITGNDGPNVLDGRGGDDLLRGRSGDDTLLGGDGNDILDGGAGADAMAGGAGDDKYYVETVGDTVSEAASQGFDRVAAAINYTLPAGVEVEVLEPVTFNATDPLNLAGNEFANLIDGNAGANMLSGGGGNDVLEGLGGSDSLFGGDGDDILIGGLGNDSMGGGAGNDKYYVEDAGDTVSEAAGAGVDLVAASVSYTLAPGAEIETLQPITFGAKDALDFTGNEFANLIDGNAGSNILDGGAGNDVLEGLGGADFFAFTTALGPNNVDRITDFLSSFDRIMIDHAVFTGLTPGRLPASAFVVGTQAQDADDHIIYNMATGALLFDADGAGGTAAVQFATLNAGLNMAAEDFLVI